MVHIHGWNFSHIYGRYSEEENLPWDFRTVINKYLKNDMKLLDMETGGGEFLLSLSHQIIFYLKHCFILKFS